MNYAFSEIENLKKRRPNQNNFTSPNRNSMETQKVCVKCKSFFFEEENYNWSCKSHKSKYTGQVYWCCGKSDLHSVGCTISKHISLEEKEVEDAEDLIGSVPFCNVFYN
jgi:hypothetical protein